MRSASLGVVIEPSTSDRSYGPLTTARDASTKYAISISSATVSSSSSQSSRLNWQPSHEANFQTASFLRLRAISNLPFAQPRPDAVESKDRPVLANESRAEQAVPAKSDRAFHIALHRNENALFADSPLPKFDYCESHHHLRAADHRDGPRRIEVRPAYQRGRHADIAAPVLAGGRIVNSHVDLHVESPAPFFQFALIKNVAGRARSVEQRDPAIFFATRENVID